MRVLDRARVWVIKVNQQMLISMMMYTSSTS
jgi:hypothetical protein